VEVQVLVVLTLTGPNGDQVDIIIRQWDDSAGTYVDISNSGARTLNASGRAEGVETFAFARLDENDRIEVWVENLSANRNVTAEAGGLVGITER
jgi:hypothetical protein